MLSPSRRTPTARRESVSVPRGAAMARSTKTSPEAGSKCLCSNQIPNRSPRIGGDEILAELFQTGAVVLAQLADVGGVHIAQHRVVLNAVIPHRQHCYLLIDLVQELLKSAARSVERER